MKPKERFALWLVATYLVFWLSGFARGAGVARSDNFSVYAESQPVADAILKYAETCRARIANEWFGRELPDGAGRATVYVEFCDGRSRTHLSKHGNHQVFLACPKADIPKVIRHEVSHCVTNTFNPWPQFVPKELDEDIALCQNTPTTDAERAELKQRLREWEARQ